MEIKPKNLKYLALLLPLWNRLRGGMPVLGKKLSTFWGKLAISGILSLVVYGHWWLMGLTAIMSFIGLSIGHGSWFPNATDKNYDAFGFIARIFEGKINRQIINFILMGLTGLAATSGLSVSLFILGRNLEASLWLAVGFSKTIAYWIAEYTPVGTKIWGAHQGIELAEWIFGLFLAIAIFVI